MVTINGSDDLIAIAKVDLLTRPSVGIVGPRFRAKERHECVRKSARYVVRASA